MAQVKVAILGVGSFTFGPSMLRQAILEHNLDGLELALIDLDPVVLELMAGVGRRMARDTGAQVTIATYTDRLEGLAGADFVISAVAREMQQRFMMDVEAIQHITPGHLISEFGGVAGISYSLRQIVLTREITDDMQRLCPDAWFFTVSNPLPRVCQAAHENGIKTVGFCSVSLLVYNLVSQILAGAPLQYPFDAGRARWSARAAGLNHFSWLLELSDRESNSELLPRLQQRLADGYTSHNPISEELCQRTGFLLTAGDDHVRDFLPPRPSTRSVTMPWHGTAAERQERLAILRAVGEGRTDWGVLFEHVSWERPFDLIAALAYDQPAEFHSLNLVNEGQISNLPRGVFVETACTADTSGVTPDAVTLPASLLPYCQRTAQVTDTIVRAALEGSRELVHEAVELDPTILSKEAGRQAIDACLEAHADILPAFQGA